MKKKLIYIMSIVMCVIIQLKAQQNNLFNTYSLDPLQLNIAYAGAVCTEVNAHYRTQWIGMKDAPKSLQLNAQTALGENSGLALKLNSQTQGLLNTLQATFGYAYRFKVSEKAKIHLGLGVGWTQASLNTQKAVVIDANDATLSTNRQKAGGFDSEFGAMLIGEKLKAGVSVLHLYNSNPEFSGSNGYKILPQVNTQISYVFNKGEKVEIEPWLLDRYTVHGSNVIEGILNFNFIRVITIGAGYRSNYGVLGLVGVKAGNLKVAYSFDYGTTKNATTLGSSHQIMLGFSLCKSAKPVKPHDDATTVAPPQTTAPAEPLKSEPKEDVVVAKEEIKVPTPIKEESKVHAPVEEKIKSEPIKEDVLPKMNKIAEEVIFDLNKAELDKTGLEKLGEIAALMKQDPTLVINIIGHTCDKGTDQINNALSFRRAAYVKAELIKKGAKAGNIQHSKGIGSEKALYDNNSGQQQKNRTVRFERAK